MKILLSKETESNIIVIDEKGETYFYPPFKGKTRRKQYQIERERINTKLIVTKKTKNKVFYKAPDGKEYPHPRPACKGKHKVSDEVCITDMGMMCAYPLEEK